MTTQPLTPTEEPAFEVGAVVRLKSGGPAMTVSALSIRPHQLLCVWISSVGQVFTQELPAIALVLSKPDVWPL